MKKNFQGKKRTQEGSSKKRNYRRFSRKSSDYRKKQQKGSGYHHRSKPLSQGPESVASRYNELLERHIRDRYKYFQYFHHGDSRKCKRLEDNFYSSLKQLRHYENSLRGEEKKWLESFTDALKPDTTYSENHQLPRENTPFIENEESPHLLSSQKESSFQDDCEESTGTMDDYRKFKV